MGKDAKEDSGFGFKDKAKALETLRLLEEHDMNYRRLTVRGLLGRAKRVLSLTKAEDKIKNIKEAMEVFENWLSDLDKEKQKDKGEKDKNSGDNTKKEDRKDEKKEKSKEKDATTNDVEMTEPDCQPSDTVPGLGFKDKEAAEGTLKEMEGRDPDYQKLAVKGLIGRAKRVLTCTKDTTKLSNIKEAISIFDKFLDDFDTQHLSKLNNPYLSLDVVRSCLKIAEERKLDVKAQKSFIAAYSKVNGEYKKLRTVPEKEGGKTWDIVRNDALRKLKEKIENTKLFTDEEQVTDAHLELLLWAYSPEATKVKKLIPVESEQSKKSEGSRKRKSSGDCESPSKKAK